MKKFLDADAMHAAMQMHKISIVYSAMDTIAYDLNRKRFRKDVEGGREILRERKNRGRNV